MNNYKSDVMKLAQTYKAQGATMSEAMKRAYSEIDKSQYQTADNAQTAASKFVESWEKASEPLGGLSEKIKTVKTPLEKLTDTIENQQQKLNQLKSYYADAVLEFGKGSSSAKRLSGEIASLSRDLEKNQDRLKQATYGVDDLGDEFQQAGKQAASFGDILLGSFAGNVLSDLFGNAVSMVQELAGAGIDAADSLTKFESTMDFAGFDSKTIQDTKKAMQDYASRTVYDLETVANTTAQLGANGVENFEALTEAAGNLNAVAGGNADTFGSVAMVLTQTAGAGKLTTENWNQLTDAIPGASGVLQKAMLDAGAYTGNFREAMENGEISAEEFNDAIMELGQSDAAVQAAQSVSTVEGSVGNLEAAITDFFTAAMTQGGGMEILTGFTNTLTTAFTNLTQNINWEEFKTTVQDALQTAKDVLTPVAEVVKDLFSFIADNWSTILSAITAIGTALLAWNVVAMIQGVIGKIQEFAKANEGLKLTQIALNAVMNANPIGLIISLIAAAVSAVITLWNTNEDFRNAVISIWETIKTTISNAIDAIVNFFTVTLPEAINEAVDWFLSIPEKLANLGSQIVQTIKDGIAAAWDGLVSWFTGLWDSLFSNRSVDVSVNQTTNADGSHAIGLDYVPYNGYIAKLHRGEMVLTHAEAENYRKGSTSSLPPISIQVYGAPGQDIETLANLVASKVSGVLYHEQKRKGAVYA